MSSRSPRVAVALLTFAVVPASVAPTTAGAASHLRSCAVVASFANDHTGLRITGLKARGVSCVTARRVADKARTSSREGGMASTTIAGERWRCRTAVLGTGSGAGTSGPSATQIECRRGPSRLVRFALRP